MMGTGVIGIAIAHTLSRERLQVAVLNSQPWGSGCSFHSIDLGWKPV